MGGWTEYDLVQAEKRMYEKRIFNEATITGALGPAKSKKRPARKALIWVLTTLAGRLTIEQPGQPSGSITAQASSA